MNPGSTNRRFSSSPRRQGKILVLMMILVPVFCGIAGLIIDGGLLMLESRHAQNVADAAATAAATELRLGNGTAAAISAAETEVQTSNGMTDAIVTVHVPPQTGPYAGVSNYVEVRIEQSVNTHLIHVLSGRQTETAAARAVAGVEDATDNAAVIVLDPDPSPFSTDPVPLAVPLNLPSIMGGLEVLGLGNARVQNAVIVNTRWGGVDENNEPAGEGAGPPYGVSCMPLLPTTKFYASDLRVAGGVDDPTNYRNVQAGQPSPLQANRLPVPDPLKTLPVPTLAADAVNVKATNYGGKSIVALPLFPVTLNPGVYDYITVVTGTVVFNPGVYIIRGIDPETQHALQLAAGKVQANGVMFYITNTASYSPATGSPDASDGETEPASSGSGTLLSSAVINLGLLGSSFSPLNSPNSPFDGMMIYQRRQDRRAIILVQENLIAGGTLQGTVYAKWGHVILAGRGEYTARFAAGTMRLIALLDMSINPSNPFPPARDVFLVE